MKNFIIVLCLIQTCLIKALPLKTRKHDILKRKPRSVDGSLGCMEMAATEGDYTYKADGSGSLCGFYIISPADTVVQLEFPEFDIDCESGGILGIVDGWEMNGEYFPGPGDHEKPLEERFNTYCGLHQPSRIFVASQNVALIPHLINVAGQGFKVKVKFVKTPQPCNVVSSTESGMHTLKNYGSRRNCSISIIYPELVELDSVDVGVTSKDSVVVADFGITNKCITPSGSDYVEVMGGNSFELTSDKERVVCGMKSNIESLETVVGCQHSVVRLVSSGNFYNTVTFSYRPPLTEELTMSNTNTAC